MPKQSARDKLKLLDQYMHELIKRFYLRFSMNGAAADLRSSGLFAYDILGRKGRCTMTELARECGLALSSMTAVIDRLVTGGYVKRVRDEGGIDERCLWNSIRKEKKSIKIFLRVRWR